MKITNYRIGSGIIALDDVIDFSITVKMGSTQKISASKDGYVEPYLIFNNLTSGESTIPLRDLYLYETHENDGCEALSFDKVSIAAGASKTFAASGVIVSPPHNTHGVGDYASTLDMLKAVSGDNGAARAYPVGLLVYADDLTNSNAAYSYRIDNAATLLLERIAPKINSVSYFDGGPSIIVENKTQTPYEYFGAYVKNKSVPMLEFDYETDPLDPQLSGLLSLEVFDADGKLVQMHTYKDPWGDDDSEGYLPDLEPIGTVDRLDPDSVRIVSVYNSDGQRIRRYGTSYDSFDLGVFDTPGHYTWICTIEDDSGNRNALTGTFNGSFDVLDYASPDINEFFAERYAISTDDTGAVIYAVEPDGLLAWFDMGVSVSAIGTDTVKNNHYSVVLTYTQEGGPDGGAEILYNATGGLSVDIHRGSEISRTLMPPDKYTFSEAYAYIFTLTVQDLFETVSRMALIDVASADFNIESNGVAVGMMSQGTSDSKLFEVAPDYKSILYGGIYGVTDYSPHEQRTYGTWIDGKPIYRKTVTVEVLKANTNTTSDVFDDNLESIVGMEGMFVRTSDKRQFPISFRYSDTSYVTSWFVDASAHVRAGWPGTAYVTAFFTKTGDVTQYDSVSLIDKDGNAIQDSTGAQVVAASETGSTVQLMHTAAAVDTAVDRANEVYGAYVNGELTGIQFTTDETLTLDENNVLRVNTASSAETDNTLPITSAAVATQIGNIEILLQTI